MWVFFFSLQLYVFCCCCREELDEVLQEWLKHIEKWENKHMGNFRRVYPGPDCEKYDKFFNNTGSLFSETAASRARIEQAK